MWFHQRNPDECTTDRTGNWFIVAQFKHPLDTLITEKMLIWACQHRPSTHDVVQLEANITVYCRTAFSLDESREIVLMFLCLFLVGVFVHSKNYNIALSG